jgi:hypothetical protein
MKPENKPIPKSGLGILLREFKDPLNISLRVNFVKGIKFGPGP